MTNLLAHAVVGRVRPFQIALVKVDLEELVVNDHGLPVRGFLKPLDPGPEPLLVVFVCDLLTV